MLEQINYPAVLVAAAAYWLIGALWYSPLLFARPWMMLTGVTEESARKSGRLMFLWAFLFELIAAHGVACVLALMTSPGGLTGLGVAITLWGGFIATSSAVNSMFAGRSRKLWFIDNGYHLVGLGAAGLILGLWR